MVAASSIAREPAWAGMVLIRLILAPPQIRIRLIFRCANHQVLAVNGKVGSSAFETDWPLGSRRIPGDRKDPRQP